MITGTSKYPPFSKLHIELLEQFECSRTFTNFIKPLLPKNRTERPWNVLHTSPLHDHVTSTGPPSRAPDAQLLFGGRAQPCTL